MQINIHNKDLEFIGLLDNDSQHTVNYCDDKWTRTLETGSSVYEFTAFKKDLDYSDEYSNSFNNLKVGNYVSFNYEGEDFLFKIMSTERTGDEVYCYCENLNLELRNEMVGRFDSSDKYRTLEDYIKEMKLIEYTNMSIGINEVNQLRKKLSFTNDETKLARLLSLLSEFGAEHRFYTNLKPNGQIKEFKLDIFTKQDAKGNGGYGRMVEDIILRKGDNVKSLKEKEDILEIWNATRPVGKKTITRVTQNKKPVKNEEQVVVKSNMVNANGSLSIENIQTILKLCYEYRLLPSGVISQLYLESFWGNSNVARVDNNWSGMTWTGNPNRPSGVVVSQGSARPSAEGGYYMHFANMSDFFKDYFFLLAKQGIYNVANKNNISDYTRGLFRVGGAKYDYAAAGFDHYNSLMNSIRNGINANNSNVLNEYDEKWKNPTIVQHNQVVEKKGAPNTKRVLQELSSMVGKTLGNGQCYGMVSWYSNKLGGAGLGAGIGGFSGLVGSGIRACDIGTDYNWPAFGWAVDGGNMFGTNLVAGAIINIKANYGAPWYTGYYGHTAVVESVNGNTVTILQQNYAGAQYVTRQKYDKNELIPSLQTIVHPKELASGGRVEGGNVVIQVDGKDEYVNLDLPTDVTTTEETVDIYIDGSLKRYWYDKDNNLEFHLVNGALYADQSSQMFPTTFTSYDNEDKWIRRDFEYQVDSEEELIEVALNDLKAHCYPASSYEVEGFFKTNIGNTHIIEDPDFEPMLTLRARVVGQELSFSNPDNNKTTLSNYVKLKSQLPNSLEDRFKDLLEQSLPYDLRVTTTNGTSFKNGLGSSKITAQLLKAGIEKEANFIFKDGNSIVGSGNELTVDATDFDSVLNLTIEAYINNSVVATRSITFTDIADGSNGSDGVGVKSTVVTYTSSTSGTTAPTSGWVADIPSVPAGSFLWTKTVWTYTDDTSKTSYSVSKMGENGRAEIRRETFYRLTNSADVPEVPSGNRNLALGTSADWSSGRTSFNGQNNQTRIIYRIYNRGLKVGDKVNVRLVLKYSDIVAAEGQTAKILPQGEGNVTHYGPGGLNVGRAIFPSGEDDEVVLTAVTTITENHLKNEYWNWRLRVDYVTSGRIVWKEAKAEISEVATPYSKAPEDLWTTTALVPTQSQRYLWKFEYVYYSDGSVEITQPVNLSIVGADGKTTYPHWAYADNSTGTVGFSLTDSSNKQYQGYYSDYYQTASTDPTKYTWVDRTANVQVGGRNLYIISKATKGYISADSEEIAAPTKENEYTSDFIPVSANDKYIFQGWVTVPENGYPWHRYQYYGADKRRISGIYYFESNTPLSGKQHYAEHITVPNSENIAYVRISARLFNDGKVKFEKGNVATDYSLAPEDIDEQINSKADEEFTTNQLNALREAESLVKKELEAKAALADVEKWYQNYLDYVSMNDEDKLNSEKELVAIAERLTSVQNDLGATKENWSFLDNYMEVAEEGLILGEKDGSAQVKISNNRISMFSNGSEVMYVTQNMLHIENGVFTKTLQIGNFRFETLDDEEEILVVRYLGGA